MTRKVANAVRRVFNKVRIFKIKNEKLFDQFIINFLTPEHGRMHPLISYRDTGKVLRNLIVLLQS